MPYDGANYDSGDKVLQVFLRTDALLAGPETWCKGTLQNPNGAMCILGALSIAADGDTSHGRTEIYVRCEAVLQNGLPARPCGMGLTPIAHFNDLPTTTFTDMKAFLAKAIAARQSALVNAA